MFKVILEALFFTDLWIFLYVRILSILNRLFPPVVNEQFVRTDVATPQPFQIPLYLILTFVFILFIKFKPRVFPRFISSSSLVQKILFSILFLFLIFNLGMFPMANDTYPFIPRPDRTLYN